MAHFDTTVSISADTNVKSKAMSEDSVRLETDGTISSFTFHMLFSLIFFDGERLDLRGSKVQQRSGVTAWSLTSGVRKASYGLRSPWMACQREGGETSCCKDDEEDMQHGRQRSDSYRASGSIPDRVLLCCAAYHAGSVCTPPPPPLTNAGRLILTESPSHLKVLPEVRARGRVRREQEIEEERGVIESLHKAHLSRVRQQGVPYGLYISRHIHP